MDDPTTGGRHLNLMGVAVPLPESGFEVEEMARTFVEEFVRMGWSDQAVVDLFRNPFYRGPYAVWQSRGEPYVRRLLAEVRRPAPANPKAEGG